MKFKAEIILSITPLEFEGEPAEIVRSSDPALVLAVTERLTAEAEARVEAAEALDGDDGILTLVERNEADLLVRLRDLIREAPRPQLEVVSR